MIGPIVRTALCFALVMVVACKGGAQVTPTDGEPSKLEVFGLGDCIKKLSIEVSQGAVHERLNIDVSSGGGTAKVSSAFKWSDAVVVVATVEEVFTRAECELVQGLRLAFSGKLTAKPGSVYALAADQLTTYRPTDVPGPPHTTVAGGKGETDRGTTTFMWAVLGDCKRTCWEQWAKVDILWDRAAADGGPVPLLVGQKIGISGQSPHTIGTTERDIPPGSDKNCFRQDPIPNVPGQTGIVDRPNYPPRTLLREVGMFGLQLLPNAPVAPDPRPLDVRVEYTMHSVLYCDDPAPAVALGYFSWGATQTLQWSSVLQTAKVNKDEYVRREPAWMQGTAGLPPGVVIR